MLTFSDFSFISLYTKKKRKLPVVKQKKILKSDYATTVTKQGVCLSYREKKRKKKSIFQVQI